MWVLGASWHLAGTVRARAGHSAIHHERSLGFQSGVLVVFWDLEHGVWDIRWLDADMRWLDSWYKGCLAHPVLTIIKLNSHSNPLVHIVHFALSLYAKVSL